VSARGFLVVDKPAGPTSFDVVRAIRRAARTRRVGHAGTLDPAATGVLPVAIGDATRFVDELVDARKRYRGVIAVGVATETYDAEGAVTAERDASHVTAEAIEGALAAFRGPQQQVPPAYSAVKREGVPAYRAARRGTPHELAARPVTVFRLDCLGVEDPGTARPRVTVDLECSKGFYVRSLAHDLGAALGVGGHLAALTRTAVGPYTIADATPLDLAVTLLERERAETIVHAPDAVLTAWPALILGRRQVSEVRLGRDVTALPRRDFRAGGPLAHVRAYGPEGRLVALMRPAGPVGAWHPYRVIAPGSPDAATETFSQS
jgi:tRNA pseudouridine55 synthase